MNAGNNRVSIVQLLSVIPEEDIRKIARKTRVDYYSKILDGKSLLYLLLYSLIETQRNSLRSMEDIFNSSSFKFLFNLDSSKKVKFNSISERLSVINIDFFKKVYDTIYDQFTLYYAEDEIEKLSLIRVDSTMVAEAANKLKRGMNIGKKKDGKEDGKKHVKYTIAFDGRYPCMSEMFTGKEHLSEDIAIPRVVYKYADKNKNCVFLFDRGVSKRKVYCDLNQNSSFFVTRLKDSFRYREVDQIRIISKIIGTLEVINDQIIKLGTPNRNQFLDDHFRLITAVSTKNQIKYFFLTNLLENEVEEILSFYKKRWDIEVFFRFLKQELNFSHLTSTSENGMMIMLYMTMIASILVLTYKRLNNIGYKTAVRRIALELNELIIKMIVKQCGGDPSLVFR